MCKFLKFCPFVIVIVKTADNTIIIMMILCFFISDLDNGFGDIFSHYFKLFSEFVVIFKALLIISRWGDLMQDKFVI